MRSRLMLAGVLLLSACHKQVSIPTIAELKANPKLLSEWTAKCATGEYAHLPAADHDNMCFTTREAGRSLAVEKAGKEESDFFKAITLRKEKRP